ncbi:MAG: efflux RND transporter periplasmic adaptor subunit [Campylobacteraceae bacterium]|jgi:Cu(I)/Ag(I) efflux system membrane fusion protein|nr:efflux RND transporter periplasmic adaptor subunit [Campylobacteraceae bacterium]
MKNIKIAAFILLSNILVFFAVWFYFSPLHVEQRAKERQILFWYDPMYPNTKFDAPGSSPFMDMDLVPKYADEKQAFEGVRIDPIQTQNLALRTQKAHFGNLVFSQSVSANLDYNNHSLVVIQPRADGFVEKAYAFSAGDSVKKGDALIDITVPEWVEAQSEYLFSKNKSVLERLRLLGMPKEDIQTLQKTLKIQTKFTIKSPINGIITAYDLRDGMNFSKDKIVAVIQSVFPIWVNAFVPESLTSFINEKSEFSIYIPSLKQEFSLLHVEVLPSVNQITKTLNLRAKIDNEKNILKPGMSAYINIKTKSDDMLLIPSSAVIDTGGEQRVITVDDNGAFVPKLIKILGESNGFTAVLGLSENESVVQTGVFLIDSEADITGALDRMRKIDND